MPKAAPLLDRIASKLLVGDGCWGWAGAKSSGYGTIELFPRPNRKTGYIHRVMYELLIGPIPDGLQIDHLCGNRECSRPSHLEPVTAAENCRRILDRQGEFACGHPVNDEHTYVRRNGHRMCRTCSRRKALEFQARKRQKLNSAPTRADEIFAEMEKEFA